METVSEKLSSCTDSSPTATASLLELHGSYEGEKSEETDSFLSYTAEKLIKDEKHTSHDVEYNTVVDAITGHILQYFVDVLEMKDCSSSESSLTEGEEVEVDEGAEEGLSSNKTSRRSTQRHKSSSSLFQLDEDLSLAKTSVRRNICSDYSLGNEVQEEEEKESESSDLVDTEPKDISHKDYFTKFKCHNKNVLMEFKNGNMYEGRISEYTMDGKGLYTWKDGSQFEGYFVKGIAQGNGYFVWPGKGWYYGEVKNNQRHGKGICVTYGDRQSEVSYYGQWKKGQRHGWGILLFGESNWYNGDWKYDQMHGEGLRVYPSGSYYRGYWKSGKAHGFGFMFWRHRDFYKGMWKQGKMHGKGTYIWRAREVNDFVFPYQNMYNGFYNNGKRHGPGRLLLASGLIVSAFWQNDMKEGWGRIICKNGIVLESSQLFQGDRINDIGNGLEIPEWNSWYFDFIRIYHEDLQQGCSIGGGKCEKMDEFSLDRISCKSCKIKPRVVNKGNVEKDNRKQALNNLPFLAPVDTLPLWGFIEMASCLKPTKETSSSVQEMMLSYQQESAEKNNEEIWLRKVITNRMPDLSYLYQHYAKIACEDASNAPDGFLLRIMLWQMCVDCKIERSCLTLCLLDKKVGFGSYPFDVIPKFEMIYYLLHLSFELCMRTNMVNKKIPGLCGSAFDYFLTNFALPGSHRPQNMLREVCSSLPLNEIYALFLSFGKKVTMKKIVGRYYFANACEEEEDLEHDVRKNPISITIPVGNIGKNVINVDGNVYFKLNENLKLKTKLPEVDMRTLTNIGEKLMMDFLIQSCPRSEKILPVNGDYEMSFYEFCKFMLLLTYEFKGYPEVLEEEDGELRDFSKLDKMSDDHNEGLLGRDDDSNISKTKIKRKKTVQTVDGSHSRKRKIASGYDVISQSTNSSHRSTTEDSLTQSKEEEILKNNGELGLKMKPSLSVKEHGQMNANSSAGYYSSINVPKSDKTALNISAVNYGKEHGLLKDGLKKKPYRFLRGDTFSRSHSDLNTLPLGIEKKLEVKKSSSAISSIGRDEKVGSNASTSSGKQKKLPKFVLAHTNSGKTNDSTSIINSKPKDNLRKSSANMPIASREGFRKGRRISHALKNIMNEEALLHQKKFKEENFTDSFESLSVDSTNDMAGKDKRTNSVSDTDPPGVKLISSHTPSTHSHTDWRLQYSKLIVSETSSNKPTRSEKS